MFLFTNAMKATIFISMTYTELESHKLYFNSDNLEQEL